MTDLFLFRRTIIWERNLMMKETLNSKLTASCRTGTARSGNWRKSCTDLSDFFLCIPQLRSCSSKIWTDRCRKYLRTSDQPNRRCIWKENCSLRGWRCSFSSSFRCSSYRIYFPEPGTCRWPHCSSWEYLRRNLQPVCPHSSRVRHQDHFRRSI